MTRAGYCEGLTQEHNTMSPARAKLWTARSMVSRNALTMRPSLPPRYTLAGITLNDSFMGCLWLTTVDIPFGFKGITKNVISYHQNTIKTIKMTTTTPTTTPIVIHFHALLLGSTGPAVGDVVGVAGLKRTSTSEMFAPITVSSADL